MANLAIRPGPNWVLHADLTKAALSGACHRGQIAAEIEHGAFDAAELQPVQRPVQGHTLGIAAKVQLQTRIAAAHPTSVLFDLGEAGLGPSSRASMSRRPWPRAGLQRDRHESPRSRPGAPTPALK
jgi:hypothetical protein